MNPALACAFAALLFASPALHAAEPSPVDLLFDTPHLSTAQTGTALTYRYTRTSEVQAFGPPVEDRIRLFVDPGTTPDKRSLRADLFSGPRHRAAGPFEDVSGNPVLALFLEHHVETLARMLSANPRYLKNALRAGLRDKASIAAILVDLNGQPVPGWRIEVRPFTDDASRARMRGLDRLTYEFVTSDAVPGTIVSIKTEARSEDGGKLLEEVLTYDPKAG